MHYSSMHPSDSTLELLAEGALPPRERAVAAAHVESCGRCTGEVEGYRSLFTALSQLPRFAPSGGFDEAVMARVTIAPQSAPMADRLEQWLPSTRRGWGIFAMAVLVPVLSIIALVAWTLTRATVAPSVLGQWAITELMDTAQSGASRAAGWFIESGILQWGRELLDPLLGVSTGVLSTFALFVAVAIPLSAWSLVHLLRTPMRETAHA